MTWVPQGEVPIIDCPDYYWSLEEFRRGEDQMVFVHLTVRKWTPRVWRNLQHVWSLFRKCVVCPLWAVSEDGTPKFEHFVSRLGFEFHSNVVCENGAERRLFVHLIDRKNVRPISTTDYKQPISELDVHVQPVERTVSVSDAGVPRR